MSDLRGLGRAGGGGGVGFRGGEEGGEGRGGRGPLRYAGGGRCSSRQGLDRPAGPPTGFRYYLAALRDLSALSAIVIPSILANGCFGPLADSRLIVRWIPSRLAIRKDTYMSPTVLQPFVTNWVPPDLERKTR